MQMMAIEIYDFDASRSLTTLPTSTFRLSGDTTDADGNKSSLDIDEDREVDR